MTPPLGGRRATRKRLERDRPTPGSRYPATKCGGCGTLAPQGAQCGWCKQWNPFIWPTPSK